MFKHAAGLGVHGVCAEFLRLFVPGLLRAAQLQRGRRGAAQPLGGTAAGGLAALPAAARNPRHPTRAETADLCRRYWKDLR